MPEIEEALDLLGEGDSWWQHGFGGVHAAGGAILSAFGLGKVADQLQTLEAEAGLLPEWSKPATSPKPPATSPAPRPPVTSRPPLISPYTGKPVPPKSAFRPPPPPGERRGAVVEPAAPAVRHILPEEMSAMVLGGALGGALGGGLGAFLWKEHRFLGAAIGFLFFGSPIGSATGLLVARRKR